MGTIAELSENPQLDRANALIKNGLKIIQRYLEPVNNRVSKVNLRAAGDLLADVTKAYVEMDLAHYETVEMLLDWATEDVGAMFLPPTFVNDLLASLPAEGGSSQMVFETSEKMLAVVVFATGTHASPVADLYRNWEASAA